MEYGTAYRSMVASYLELFKENGVSPKSLGWMNGKQFLRFKQLLDGIALNDMHLLDVGCGFGDLILYLKNLNIKNFEYTGYDIVDTFIKEAQKIHHSPTTHFIQGDFLDHTPKGIVYDFGVASGTFNHFLEGIDPYTMVNAFMKKMLQSCRIGISLDFLSDQVDYKNDHNFHYSPIKILEMGYQYSKNVSLNNHFFPFEFSVRILKDESFSKKTTTFLDIEKKFKHLI